MGCATVPLHTPPGFGPRGDPFHGSLPGMAGCDCGCGAGETVRDPGWMPGEAELGKVMLMGGIGGHERSAPFGGLRLLSLGASARSPGLDGLERRARVTSSSGACTLFDSPTPSSAHCTLDCSSDLKGTDEECQAWIDDCTTHVLAESELDAYASTEIPPTIRGETETERELIQAAWSLLLDNVDLVRWAICLVFGSDRAEDLMDRLTDHLDGSRWTGVYMLDTSVGGPFFVPPTTYSSILYIVRGSELWQYYLRLWTSGDHTSRTCAALDFAAGLAHELCHVARYSIADVEFDGDGTIGSCFKSLTPLTTCLLGTFTRRRGFMPENWTPRRDSRKAPPGSYRMFIWVIGALSCTLLECQPDYYWVDDFDEPPLFVSTEAGTVYEGTWEIVAKAPNWNAIDSIDLTVSVLDLRSTATTVRKSDNDATRDEGGTSIVAESGETVHTGETGADSESAWTRITLTSEDGMVATLDHTRSFSHADFVILDLPTCELTETSCRREVHLKIESLSSRHMVLDPLIYAQLIVHGGCLGPAERDTRGVAVSIEQIEE